MTLRMTGMRVSTAKRRSARVAPTQLRSVRTRERLLDVAGELLRFNERPRGQVWKLINTA